MGLSPRLRGNRHWHGGGKDEVAQDAEIFGIRLDDADPDFVVMPEAWDAVRLFCGCSTQWRIGPMGHRLGLDYRGAAAAAAGLGIRWKAVFENLQIMEDAVLAADGEDAQS